MPEPSINFQKPRFPLFGKVIIGFVMLIGFMMFSSIILLLQVRGAFTSGDYDIQMTQKKVGFSLVLDKTFDSERESWQKYLITSDSTSLSGFFEKKSTFESILDSLKDSTTKNEAHLLESVLSYHSNFNRIVSEVITSNLDKQSSEIKSLKLKSELVDDSLSAVLEKLNDTYRYSLNKMFGAFDRRISLATNTAVIILLLTLVIALATAVLITRTIIKPIQALKEGTRLVSEGHYSTIPVTTNDEVADLTRAFNLMNEKLRQLDEMRIQLMSEISHEMRTPLQVIKAGCHAITHSKEAAPLIPRQTDAVAMIHQATNRINRFVTSFLDVVKMESGLMKYSFEPTDLLELMNPLVHEAQLIGQTRQIVVEFFHDDSITPLNLDQDKMIQVVSNLISNAMKYTPNNGHITIRATKTYEMNGTPSAKEFVRIDVQDTGVGISQEDLEKLFTKFFQANNKAVVNEKGSGLGLTLVKHIAEAHGGRVAVASKVNVGSTFSIILPTSGVEATVS